MTVECVAPDKHQAMVIATGNNNPVYGGES
jgi:hypothetical protein